MFMNGFDLTWYDDGYYCTLHFDISPIDLDLYLRSQECEKAKTSVPIISHSQSFQPVWMEFGVLFSLAGVMNLIPILLVYSIFKGENPTYIILLPKKC